MKILISKILIIFLLFPNFLLVAATISDSDDPASKILLIIHSYSPDFEFTRNEDKGIMKAFNRHLALTNNWSIERFYFHGKTKKSAMEVKESIRKAKDLIQSIKPDAVILTDDLAFKSLYRFVKNQGIPLSFSGINGNIRDYGYVEGESGITGSIERYNVPAVVKIMKRLRTTINSILIISDENITGKALLRQFMNQIKSNHSLKEMGIHSVKGFAGASFEALKRRLLSVNPKRTGVIVLASYSYRNENGTPISYDKINNWIFENTNFIDMGLIAFHMDKKGRLFGLASSAEEMGNYSATLLFKAILAKKDPSTYGIREQLPLNLYLNHDRAKKLGITFPFEILSYAKTFEALMSQKSIKR